MLSSRSSFGTSPLESSGSAGAVNGGGTRRLSLLDVGRLLGLDETRLNPQPVVVVATLNHLASEIFEPRAAFSGSHDIGSAVRLIHYQLKCKAQGGLVVEQFSWSYRDFSNAPQPVFLKVIPSTSEIFGPDGVYADMGGSPVASNFTVWDQSGVVPTDPGVEFPADGNLESPFRWYVPYGHKFRLTPSTDTGSLVVAGLWREIPEGPFSS